MKNTIQTPIDLHIDFDNLTEAGIDHKVKHEASAQLIWRIKIDENIAEPKFERLFARGVVSTRNEAAKSHGFKFNAERKHWELKLTQSWHRRLLAETKVKFKNFMELYSGAAVWIPMKIVIKITPHGTESTVICATKLPLR